MRPYVKYGFGRVFLPRLWSLIAHSDTTPTRFMLAITASMWAILLAWPGDTSERPTYAYMVSIAGNHAELKWCTLWALHAGGMWWRIFSSTPSASWALAIHTLGLALFSSAAIGVAMTITPPVPAATAPDFVLALAAFWVLVRTHINSERGWRDD